MYIHRLTPDMSMQLYGNTDAEREVYFAYAGHDFAAGVEGWDKTTDTHDGDMWVCNVRYRETGEIIECARPCDDMADAVSVACEAIWDAKGYTATWHY